MNSWYIVRNKNGTLYLHESKPKRHFPNVLKKYFNWCNDNDFYWVSTDPTSFFTILDDSKYPEYKDVKWDDEPLSVFLIRNNTKHYDADMESLLWKEFTESKEYKEYLHEIDTGIVNQLIDSYNRSKEGTLHPICYK